MYKLSVAYYLVLQIDKNLQYTVRTIVGGQNPGGNVTHTAVALHKLLFVLIL